MKSKDTDWTSGWIRIHYRMDESFGKYIQCNVKDGWINHIVTENQLDSDLHAVDIRCSFPYFSWDSKHWILFVRCVLQ